VSDWLKIYKFLNFDNKFRGNGVSGAHNRFTHYACPVMKAIKTNSGSTGAVSNMIPSLQHVYIVSMLLGKVEYVPRQNVYDKSGRKQISKQFFFFYLYHSYLFEVYFMLTLKRNGNV
jgi:hypothetical protein